MLISKETLETCCKATLDILKNNTVNTDKKVLTILFFLSKLSFSS